MKQEPEESLAIWGTKLIVSGADADGGTPSPTDDTWDTHRHDGVWGPKVDKSPVSNVWGNSS